MKDVFALYLFYPGLLNLSSIISQAALRIRSQKNSHGMLILILDGLRKNEIMYWVKNLYIILLKQVAILYSMI